MTADELRHDAEQAWSIASRTSMLRAAATMGKLEQDARRYQHIRDVMSIGEGDSEHGFVWSIRHIPGRHGTFDAAIDAEISTGGAE